MRILIGLFFGLITSFAQADVITPEEEFGQVSVSVPDEKIYQAKGFTKPDFNIWITNEKGNAIKVNPGTSYDVIAGEVCITVRSGVIQTQRCGLTVAKDQLTTITTAAVGFYRDPSVTKVDFGFTDRVQFQIGKAPLSVLSFTGAGKYRTYLVTGSMPVEAKYTAPDILTDQVFGLKTLKSLDLTTLDVTPADRVAKIKVLKTERKFQASKENYASLLIRRYSSFDPANSKNHGYHSRKIFGQSDIKRVQIQSARVLPLRRDRAFRLFPLTAKDLKDYRIEFTVNGVPEFIEPSPGQTTELEVKTIGVAHFKDKGPGFYKIYQLDPTVADPTKNQIEVKIPSRGGYGFLRDSSRPTETGIDLPYGHLYRFDFFIEDNFGTLSLEDSAEVDLR
ncbi:MAG: hypothetical protein AAF203_10475 [Pseudomonadota bacterium]